MVETRTMRLSLLHHAQHAPEIPATHSSIRTPFRVTTEPESPEVTTDSPPPLSADVQLMITTSVNVEVMPIAA